MLSYLLFGFLRLDTKHTLPVLQRNMAARIALGLCVGTLTLAGFATKAGTPRNNRSNHRGIRC